MLVSLSEVLETPVSTLLGETVTESQADDLKVIAQKLEIINLQLAKRKESKRNWQKFSLPPYLKLQNPKCHIYHTVPLTLLCVLIYQDY